MGYPASNTAHLLRACQQQAWLRACTNPVGKVLWFIESLLGSDISLDELAGIGGVSPHHMVRAFACATGQSILHYVRGRRLTEAARLLANGPPDVSAVALEYGYTSHEAFTRAFFDQFGVSPERVRLQRHLDHVELVEPVRIDEALRINLEPPRFEMRGIPEQLYAVFVHRGALTDLRRIWHTVWNHWLPESGYAAVDTPEFERYTARGIEIWVPVTKQANIQGGASKI